MAVQAERWSVDIEPKEAARVQQQEESLLQLQIIRPFPQGLQVCRSFSSNKKGHMSRDCPEAVAGV